MATEVAYPMYITKARQNKMMPWLFGMPLGHWLSYKLSERRAGKETLASLQKAYDAAHQRLLILVEGIKDEEWKLTSVIPKPRDKTIKMLSLIRHRLRMRWH
jgi:hypothetical protein